VTEWVSFRGMDVNEFMEPYSAALAATGEASVTQVIEVVPVTGDTDGPCSTECDSGDWYAEVKQEILQQIKEEPDNVCCLLF